MLTSPLLILVKLLAAGLAFGVAAAWLVRARRPRPMRVDPLTQLPNRLALEREHQGQRRLAMATHTRLGLIYIDLDEFKRVNLRHGRDIGDEALRLLALRFRRSLMPKEFLGRVGSDEFAILVRDAPGPSRLKERVQSLREASDAPMVIDGRVVYLGFSCGVAVSDYGGAPLQSLVSLATVDMDDCKRGKQQRMAGAVASLA